MTITRSAEPGNFEWLWLLLQRQDAAFWLRLRMKGTGYSDSGSSGSIFGSGSLDSGTFWMAPVPIPDREKCLRPSSVSKSMSDVYVSGSVSRQSVLAPTATAMALALAPAPHPLS